MPSVSIRRLISVIGLLVALATAIAIPAGYTVTSYLDEADALSFKARLNADRVAKYIYAQGALWPFHGVRLGELIEISQAGEQDLVSQRIYAAPDRLVLNAQRALAWPTLARSAPISVGGETVGRIEVEASLRPLITRTASVAMFSILLAGLGFVFMSTFPLRVLDRTMAELGRRDEQLRAQNYRFETAIDNLSQGLCMFDSGQRLVVSNRQYQTMYGLDADLSKPGTELRTISERRRACGYGPKETPGELADHLLTFLPRPEASWYEVVELRDGRTIAISCRRMIGGGWIALHDDITERRAAELARIRIAAEAEQLRQQERAAEMANRAKSTFLATMSHEIRTPMNAVLGLTSSLLEAELDPEHRSTLVAIHDSGESLMRILNDILDYSKLDAGKLEFEELAFSPAILIEHLIGIIGPRATSKGLTIRALNDPSLPPALIGDAGRLRQVLLNLLSNAVKFTPAGEITVTTRSLGRQAERISIEWTVRDTGIGIAADRIDTLFGDFVQADTSISRQYGGSGLGLAISRRIVEQMGGEITLTSTLGVGSTFRVVLSLPWADSISMEEPSDRGQVAALKAQIADLGRPLRILIAEDNPTNQLVAVKMLQEFDVHTRIAADGLEAIAAVDRFAFDVVLMDVRMPEMDGLEATRTIRSRGGPLADLPIIALTANAFAHEIKACRDAGMNDFLAKPTRKHLLVEAILRVMPGIPGRQRTAHPAEAGPAVAAANLTTSDRGPPGQPPAADRPATLDLATIDNLATEIGLDGVQQILAVFLQETGRRLTFLRTLACATDRGTIEIEAHTLKGAAGTFGLHELSALAKELEKGAGAVTEQRYRDALDRLDQAFNDARVRIPVEFLDAESV